MSKIPILERLQFPIYNDAAHYTAVTGRHAPWDPTKPVRHWEALGEPGPYNTIPNDQVGLGVFDGDATLVNIPCVPYTVSWAPPSVDVTVNGQPRADVLFSTREEAIAIMEEMNVAAKGTSNPAIVMSSLRENQGLFLFRYVYGSAEKRRCWEFFDMAGTEYNAGERIAHRNRAGSAILRATWNATLNRAEDKALPPGVWTYASDTKVWYFKLEAGLESNEPLPAKAGSVRPAVKLLPGESLVWAPSTMPGVLEPVVQGQADIESKYGPLSALDKELLRIGQETAARVANIEAMLKRATGVQ